MRRVLLFALLASAGCSLVVGLDGLSGSSVGDASVDAGVDARLPLDGPDGSPGAIDASTSAYAQAVLADQPSAYYRFEEQSLAIAKDSSGNGHDGTYAGGAGPSAPGALANENSHAIHLNGKSAWVKLGNLLHFAARAPMTLEAWIRPEPFSSYVGIVTNENSASNAGYRLLMSASEGISMERIRDGGSDDTNFIPAPPLGAWSHVVATYDGSVVIVYANGQEMVRHSYSTSLAAPSDAVLGMGARSGGTNGFFAGSLDEVAIYDHVLSASRVATHYTVGVGH